MKRFLISFFAILLCFSLVACGVSGGDPSDSDSESDNGGTVAQSESNDPGAPVNIILDGVTEYKVIRPDVNNAAIVSAASDLRTKLNEATSANVGIGSDWFKPGDEPSKDACEIVVGNCNRPATEKILKELRERDFAIVYEDGRIYIIGGCDDSTVRAVDYFLENYLNTSAKSLIVQSNLHYIDRYEYALGMISISGVMITEYQIVIPANCGLYVSAAAQNLSDYLYYNGGIELDIVKDSASAGDYEILVGKTNRSESTAAAKVSLGANDYVLAITGSKVVMMGDSYMIGGAVSDFVNNHAASRGKDVDIDITSIPTECKASTFKFGEAKNAILLIGDGMGFNHVKAAIDNKVLTEFVAEQLPNIGSVSTYSQSVTLGKASYTDSAAAATSLATGYKTINAYLGIDASQRTVTNVRELAASKGARTAVLTTDVITGATPAGFLVHTASRDSTAIIQAQIDELLKNNRVEFAVGGIDNKLVEEAGRQLWTISENGSLFFSMIEAALIDKRSHSNDMSGVLNMVVRYNDLIAYCVQFALCHPDTALIITADHETGSLTYNSAAQKYEFKSTVHSNVDVPVYAIGPGTEYFTKKIDNTDIAKFIAKIYGASSFGG